MGFTSSRGHHGVIAHEPIQPLPSPGVRILLTEAGLRARERELDQLRAAKHRLVGSHEAEEPGDVSIGSPVGQALLGRRANEGVTVSRPHGRTRRLRIVSVAPPT